MCLPRFIDVHPRRDLRANRIQDPIEMQFLIRWPTDSADTLSALLGVPDPLDSREHSLCSLIAKVREHLARDHAEYHL